MRHVAIARHRPARLPILRLAAFHVPRRFSPRNASLFVGPVFTREAAATPRNWRLYFLRALYVAALFLLVATAWLILFGSQPVRTLADLSRFGAAAFALVAPV